MTIFLKNEMAKEVLSEKERFKEAICDKTCISISFYTRWNPSRFYWKFQPVYELTDFQVFPPLIPEAS